MAYSFDEHTTANGRTYAYTFDAVTHDTSNIKVTVGGKHLYDGVSKYDTTNRVPSDSGSVQGVEYTLTGDSTGGTITINSDVNITDYVASGVPTLSASQILRISRQTNRTTAEISFSSDSVLTDTDLNKSNNQARFLALESIDRTNEGIAIDENDSSRYNLQVDSNDKKIFGVATPTVDNEAANKAYVDGNANIATVAGQISPTNNIASVAGQITPTNNISTVAGKVGDIEKVAHLEDGTTATSAVSKVASRESEIEKLGTDAMTDTSTGYLTKLGVDSMSNATTGNLKKVGDKATEVESVAGKVTEIDTIVNKYDGTDASSGTNKNLVQIDVVADAVANINTVATNIGNVNNFANTYLGAVDGGTDHSNAPTSNRTEGDLYYNTNSSKKGLFVYNGSAWESLETEISGNIVTSTTGENLTLTTPSDSNNVVINSTTGTSGNTILLPKVRATENNYVLAMSDKTTGETAWQITQTAPTITSVSGLLNVDSDSTLTIIGEDFDANTSVKLFSASTGGTEVASATVDTSGVPLKLVATFGHANLTAGDQLFVELGNGSLLTRHQTGITVNVDPTATFSGGSGANYSASTHLGTYGIQVAGGGQDSNTKLLLNFDRWGGTDIEDSSNTGGEGHKVPTNGQTSIKSSPFGDGKSAMYFSSGNDKLVIPASGDFDLEKTSIFTIDFWFYRGSTDSYQRIISQDTGSNYNGWAIHTSGGGQIEFGVDNGTKAISTTDNPLNTWHYVRITGDGTNIRFYIDGVLDKTQAVSGITDFNQTNKGVVIGIRPDDTYDLNGAYIDELRIINGTALTTGDSHDVPTTRFTGNETNTKLLIHSDKEDDASDSKHLITASEAIQKTDQNKFGGSSWYFDGSDDHLEIAHSADFDFGAGASGSTTNDFTIECWFRRSNNTAYQALLGKSNDNSSSAQYLDAWFITIDNSGATNSIKLNVDDVAIAGNIWSYSVDTWYHLALVRSENVFTFYIDGTALTNTTTSTVSLNKTGKFYIGAGANAGSHELNIGGYIDDLRVTKGLAVYTGNFTAPTSALTKTWSASTGIAGNTDASKVKLLIHGDGAKFTDSATSGTTHTITPTGSYHSQAHGGIAPAMAWPASLKETGSVGVYFDGDQDHLLLFDDATTNKNDIVTAWCTGSWSLDCWLYMTAYPANTNGFTILSTTDGVTYGTDIGYYNATSGGTGYWGWIAGSAFSPQTDQTTDTPALNTWMHLLFVLSWSGTTMSMKVYKDGKYLGSQSYASGSSNTNFNDYDDLDYMTIGGNAYNSGGGGSSSDRKNWNGYIDNYRFSTGDVTADSTDPLYTNSQTSTSSNNFISGLPTQIYGAYTPKTIDTITFTGTTSQALAGDEDIEFSEVTNTNQPAEKQDFSDIGLSITNLTGSDKNKATLTGTLNFAHNTSVPKLAMKVQVRKTLGNSAGTSGQATITFSSGTTTAGLSPNMIVTGTGINTSETKITSVDSSTQITVDNNHAGTVSGDLIFLDPDRVAHMNGSDTYSTGDTALTIATGDGNPVLFNARRYHGTGSARDINGFGFQPDFCWIKARNASRSHYVWDSVTNLGDSPVLPDTNTASIATAQGHISSFISDGITIADGSSGDLNVNDSGDQYIAWGWKAGGAPSGDGKRKRSNSTTEDSLSSGTDYSTSISAIRQSVNVEGDFSITKYTGNSTSDAGWFKHGLSGTPDFMIVKNLDATQNWFCWHSGLGASNISTGKTYILLDEGYQVAYVPPGAVNTQDLWTSTGHTSTTINLKNHISMNWVMNNQSFICYAWKSKEKVSAFGTYTGSGGAYDSSTGKGGVTDVGFKPKWIMLKCVDANHPWVIFDSFREETDIKNNYIRANEPDSGADSATLAWEFKSTGFESTSANTGTWTNETDKTYIYMAFA